MSQFHIILLLTITNLYPPTPMYFNQVKQRIYSKTIYSIYILTMFVVFVIRDDNDDDDDDDENDDDLASLGVMNQY